MAGLNAPPSFAQGSGPQKQKVAADLRAKARTADTYDEVDVILRPAAAWTPALDADLKSKGAVKKPAYANYSFRAVRMKARDVEALAARADVAYVSPNREVKLPGHLSLTTGADAARALGGGSGNSAYTATVTAATPR